MLLVEMNFIHSVFIEDEGAGGGQARWRHMLPAAPLQDMPCFAVGGWCALCSHVMSICRAMHVCLPRGNETYL